MTRKLTAYGKWALITGASSGIGREFARQIAAQGMNCVLAARRLDRLEALATELREAHGVECRCVQVDLSRDGFVEVLTLATRDIAIDVLINNAGFGHPGRFETRSFDQLDALVRVNCLAPTLLTRAYLPGMVERNRGALIFVGSAASFISLPYDAPYCASKSFDMRLGEALWGEMRGTGVDVITLCPDITQTEFFEVEGHSPEQRKKIHRGADTPQYIASLALKHLGRKAVVGPRSTRVYMFLARLLPRKLQTLASRFVMRNKLGAHKVE